MSPRWALRRCWWSESFRPSRKSTNRVRPSCSSSRTPTWLWRSLPAATSWRPGPSSTPPRQKSCARIRRSAKHIWARFSSSSRYNLLLMRIYLIDGYSLLYRAFYALPQSIATTSGLPTNALYGFTSMVLKLLDSEEEVGIGVVWDGGMPAFRVEIFPEYKANRSSMPEELRVQLDHLDEILEAMNIPAIRAEGFEADDALATLSRRVPEGVELFIVTGDQDAMQLVDGRVKVLRTTRGVSETKAYGRDEVIEEYGVTPEQIPDYKALVGDPSDNIPGVKGIGPKGAANLLKEFGTVENLYENLDKVSAKGTRKKLEEGRESALVSLELAKMRFDAPVEFDAEELRFRGVSPESRDVLLRRYEFRTLEPRFAALPVVGGEELPPVERLAVRLST